MMPILILAVVMFFAMLIATAFALNAENKKQIPVRTRTRY